MNNQNTLAGQSVGVKMKPTTIAQNFRALPAELRTLRIWLVWEYRRNKRGEWDKVPLIADGSGRYAKSNKPETWRTYQEALEFIPPGGGIACCVVEPYCFIDLDCCRNRETGEITPWGRRIVEFFASYVEVSPSGTGLHVLVKLTCKLPEGDRKHGSKKVGWEIAFYDVTSPRYFCWTGVVFEGRTTVNTVDAAAFYPQFVRGDWDVVKSPRPNGKADERAESAQPRTAFEPVGDAQGNKLNRLKCGEWQPFYPSQSEADMALCRILRGDFTTIQSSSTRLFANRDSCGRSGMKPARGDLRQSDHRESHSRRKPRGRAKRSRWSHWHS